MVRSRFLHWMLAALACAVLAACAGRHLDRVLKGRHMSEKAQLAAAQLAEFEQKKEPVCLQNAADLLEGVDLAKEKDSLERLVARRETLELWLALLSLIDQNLDAGFDPNRKPQSKVLPPPGAPPGAAPEDLPDPQASQRYRQALQANDDYADRYRLQTWLRKLDQKLFPKVERFVRISYTTAPRDQRELLDSLGKLVRNQARAEALRRAASSKQ